MEEIKMYAVKWKGEASECEYEVAKVMRKIAETCVQACADDAFTTVSEDGTFLGCKNIKINIVTTKKETAYSMAEWMEEFAGIKMEVKEIQVSPPLPFEN